MVSFLTNPMIFVFAIKGQKCHKGYYTLNVNEIWLQDCQWWPNYPLLVTWLSTYTLSLNINSFYHSQLNTTPSFSLHSLQCYNSVDLRETRRISEHKGGSLVPQGCCPCCWHMMTEATHIFPVGKILSCLEMGLNSCCRAHALPIQAYSIFIKVLLDDHEWLKKIIPESIAQIFVLWHISM